MQEKIQLTVDSSAIKGNSLGALLAELRTVDAAIAQIHSRLGKGPNIGAAWLQPVEQIKQKLDRTFKTKGPYGASDVLKAIGLDEASVNQALARLNEMGSKLKGFQTKSGTFSSLNTAANGVSQTLRAEVAALNQAMAGAQTAIGKALRGEGPKGATFSGKDFAVKVDGQINLVIPGTQIQASVSGPVTLKVAVEGTPAAAGGAPAGASTGRSPETGQFTGGGHKSKSKGGAQPLDIASQRGETSRVRTERIENGVVTLRQEAITRVNEMGNVITDTHDSIEGIIKQVTKSTTANSPLAEYRQARRIMAEQFKQQKAAMVDTLPADLQWRDIYTKQATVLRGMGKAENGKYLHPALAGLPEPAADQAAALLNATAATLEEKALAAHRAVRAPGQQAMAAIQASQLGTMSRNNWINFLQGTAGQGVPVNVGTGMPSSAAADLRKQFSEQADKAAKAAERAAQPPKNLGSPQWGAMAAIQASQLGTMSRNNWMSFLQGPAGQGVPVAVGTGMAPSPAAAMRNYYNQQAAAASKKATPPPLPATPPPLPVVKPTRLAAAVSASFAPENMLIHTIKAAGWATAITAIYKPLELVEYSLKRMLDLGEQVAHLSVIFHGVGGSAKELTEDVLRLASANGRSSDEAMESATEWARLGLSRVQVNKAVQISLEAANVAQVSVGEATKQLAAQMHIYGMTVDQLDGALGTMVNTSQTFNVTTEDLLGGLDRAAAAGKVAGVSFAELQGLIGATVGGTGQSGVQVGNTIKNLFTQFTRPEIQQYLQTQGIASTSGNQFGNGSEVLRRMFIQYQKMDPTQQRNLGTVIAGRLQTARFAGMMNEYPKAEQLAIEGLLRQNAALETNQRVVQTLRAQVHGLGAEWDRVLVNSGGHDVLTTATRNAKNAVGAFGDMMIGGSDAFRKNQTVAEAQAKAIANTKPDSLARVGGVLGALAATSLRFTPFTMGVANTGLLGQQAGLFDIITALREGDNNQPSPEDAFNKAGRHQEAMQLIQKQMETAAEMQQGGLNTEGARQTYENARKNFAELGLPPGADFSRGVVVAQEKQVDDLMAKIMALAQMKQKADTELAGGKLTSAAYDKQIEEIKRLGNAEQAAADEVLSTVEEQIARKQEYINLLKEEVGVTELVARLAGQVATGTLTGETSQQEYSVKARIASLQERMQSVAETTPVSVEANPIYQDLVRQMSDAKAQLAMIQSPRYQAAVETYDNRNIAVRRAAAESNSYAVGYTEAEKLVRQQGALRAELGTLTERRDLGTATDNDLVRGLQLEVELAKNHEQIQLRIVELKGQEKQILIEANREYQKSMLMSGPGELLKRLYAGTRGNMSTGQFMSLDPELRRHYYDQRGGEAGAKNREEQAIFRGWHLDVPGEQAQAKGDRKDTDKWIAAQNNPTAGMPGLPPPKTDELLTQAMRSAQALSDFTGRLLSATNAVGALSDAIARLTPGGTQANHPGTPAPHMDISSGHALGATTLTKCF